MNFIGLDLSTKTGFVKLSPTGEVLEEKELVHKCDTPESMYEMQQDVLRGINQGDIIAIENFGFNSQQGIQLGGIGWIVRMELWVLNYKFYTVAPNSLKKFAVGKGTADKRELAVNVNNRWGYFNKSDNITDAFVLAHIARAIHEPVELTKFQQEVLDTVLNKKPKKSGRKKV